MAGYPWFKFDAESWLSGSIQFQPPAHQAIFINIASLYWKNKRPVTLREIIVRYPVDADLVNAAIASLVAAELIKFHEGGYVVGFLFLQIESNQIKSNGRAKAANTRWQKIPPNDANASTDNAIASDSMQMHPNDMHLHDSDNISDADKIRLDKIRLENINTHASEDLFDESSSNESTELTAPSWSFERLKPWAMDLIRAGAKIGDRNWTRWEILDLKHGTDKLVDAITATPPEKRWPDVVESRLKSQFNGDNIQTDENGGVVL